MASRLRLAREALPYLPMSLHLIVSALAPVWTGSHASLTRPASAAKPASRKTKGKRTGGGHTSDSEEDFEDEEDDVVTKMEGMSPSDAIMFPLLAGCTLGGLYLLINYLGPALLNKVLAVYFGAMAVFSVARMINDILGVVQSFVFPRFYSNNGLLWMVRPRQGEAQPVSGGSNVTSTKGAAHTRRDNPLPGLLGSIDLGPSLRSALWRTRAFLLSKYLVAFHLRGVTSIKAKVSMRSIVSSVVTVVVLLYANFVSMPWYLTNLQGFAFSYTALQLLSPTTFGTGSLILVALFFYDIYFVFYTPLMVSVATNLDVPIKLLFPRPAEEGKKPGLAMLGLGDIVLPGIMMGLALRFDLYLYYSRKQQKSKTGDNKEGVVKANYVSVTGKWGEYFWTAWPPVKSSADSKMAKIEDLLPRFPRTYFNASIVGYILGMTVTLIIMQVFKHAQPALLYLVPGVLGSIWLTALARGEIKEMWEYTEMVDEDEDEDDKKKETEKETDKDKADTSKDDKTMWSSINDFFSTSFFGAEKQEKNAKRLEDSIKRSVESSDGTNKAGEPNSFFAFSIKPAPLKKRKLERETSTAPSDGTRGSSVMDTLDGPRRRSARLARPRSDSEGSDDAILINKADAASFIDEGTIGGRKRKSRT